MVFTMRASAIAKLIFLFFLCFAVAANAKTFTINNAEVIKIGNGYILNAHISYPLTPRVIQALDNGVPITFYQRFELVEPYPVIGQYLDWRETIWSTEIQFELRYHALTQQYVLFTIDTQHHRTFSSLSSALAAMGEIKGFTLPPEHLEHVGDKVLQLKSGLNLHALPTPMRPGALVSSKWQLDSPWTTAKW